MRLTRRSVVRIGALAALSPILDRLGLPLMRTLLGTPANAQERRWQHGLSLFGELKYPEGFKHFDYVNPKAPKAGTVRMLAIRNLRQLQRGHCRAEGVGSRRAPG